MNIFYHEFKSYLKSVGIWSAALFLIILVYFSAFNSFAVEAEQFSQLMDSFPEELLIAFGMTDLATRPRGRLRTLRPDLAPGSAHTVRSERAQFHRCNNHRSGGGTDARGLALREQLTARPVPSP